MQQGNFQYLISAKLDPKGFEQTKQAVSEVNKETAAGALKAETATRKLTEGQRNLKDAIRGVALQFPILGRFAEAAINPLIGGIGLVISAATALFFRLRDIKQTLSDVIQIDAAGEIKRIAQAAQDGELAGAAYTQELERIAAANKSIADSTNDVVKAIQDRAVAEAEIADAEKALALARINKAERDGTISATTAIERRAEIEQRFAEDRVKRENRVAQDIIAARQAELEATKKAIADNSAALESLRAKAKTLGTEDDLQATIDKEIKKKEELDKLVKKQESFVSGMRATGGFGINYQLPEEERVLAQRKAQRDAVSTRVGELLATQPELRREIQATGKQIGLTEAQDQALRKREDSLSAELPSLIDQSANAATQRSTLLGLETQRRQVDVSAATAVPVTAADQLQASQMLQAAQAAPGATMDNLVSQIMADGKQADQGLLQAIEQMSKLMTRFTITVEMLNKRLTEQEADVTRKLNYQ